MTKEQMINIAKSAMNKSIDFETLYYSDYMYGEESLSDEVWKLVEECREIGTIAFSEKYDT